MEKKKEVVTLTDRKIKNIQARVKHPQCQWKTGEME
jgi:hypothetical protein